MTAAAIALGANLLVWIPLGLWIRRRAQRARAELAEEVGGRAVLRAGGARFYGRRSAGLGQIRGTGHLAVTSDEVVFVQWVPRRTLRVRRDDIEAIDTPRAFLVKTSGRRLLRIRWRDGAEVDEVAWEVSELDEWLGVLGAADAAQPSA